MAMNSNELKEMRKDITAVIDDIKYHSDQLTDLDRLPVLQLKVILAKIGRLNQMTTILLHYIEKQEKHIQNQQDSVSKNELAQTEEEVSEILNIVDEHAPDTERSSKSENVEDRLKKMVVHDLMSAIGINEKYLFASELFDGNINRFTEEIAAINSMKDFNEVENRIIALSGELNWDPENEFVEHFKELIYRKFDQ